MKTKTFIVTLEDPATKDFGGIAKVIIEDPFVYDEDMMMAAREALAHLYDCPIEMVVTEEEYCNRRFAAMEPTPPTSPENSSEPRLFIES